MNIKIKVWSDSWGCAEEWRWNGQTVLRYKMAKTYPWEYRIGVFTKDHCRFASNDRDRHMTQDEIQSFKAATTGKKVTA